MGPKYEPGLKGDEILSEVCQGTGCVLYTNPLTKHREHTQTRKPRSLIEQEGNIHVQSTPETLRVEKQIQAPLTPRSGWSP